MAVSITRKDEERRKDAEFIMDKYGVDKHDPAMREAAEIAAARTQEALQMAQTHRRYY